MGLDSILLLTEWEKYFGIDIPNPVAEKMLTVQHAVDAIADLLNITNTNPTLRNDVFSRLQEAISKTGASDITVTQQDLVHTFFPNNDKQTWTALSNELGLPIPIPPRNAGNTAKNKILSKLIWIPKFNYNELTFSKLTDAICGMNYKKLIDPKAFVSRYEIYCAISGITQDVIGIDIYEVEPHKTFTSDFGID
ncbi:MAG: hypothetical protein JST26_07300 [Bacteroidetes bacterium]|nr:hypothetical protein [Bacteroidota bacterium]